MKEKKIEKLKSSSFLSQKEVDIIKFKQIEKETIIRLRNFVILSFFLKNVSMYKEKKRWELWWECKLQKNAFIEKSYYVYTPK